MNTAMAIQTIFGCSSSVPQFPRFYSTKLSHSRIPFPFPFSRQIYLSILTSSMATSSQPSYKTFETTNALDEVEIIQRIQSHQEKATRILAVEEIRTVLGNSTRGSLSTFSYKTGLEFVNPVIPTYKWRLLISYDGTRYSGWQYQASSPTIQCAIENALIKTTKLDRKDLCLVGAGRTDKGVHAWGQVAHFLTPFNYNTLDDVHAALNGLLPSDIRVREIAPALPEFHARFSTTGKIYRYSIYNDSVIEPFRRHYAYHSGYDLNASVMAEAATYFVGKHDFTAFANAMHNDRVRDPEKTITRFDVREEGPVIELEVEGSGFLYRQVRNMVALLLQIGKEAIPPEIVPKILETRNRRELAKYTLVSPPHGLCLVEVKYKEDHMGVPLGSPSISSGRRHTISRCKLPYY